MSSLRLWIPAVLAVLSTTPSSAAIPSSERSALEAVYSSTNGAQWRLKEGWQGAAGTECTWRGITCDASGSTVTGLNLGYNNLVGPLPAAIGDFANLEALSLAGNQISGSLPDRTGSLTRLRSLDIRSNRLTGAVPRSIGNLRALTTLNLGSNELSGTIPVEIGQLTNLLSLNLWANRLTGTIPAELGSLTRLQELRLSYNELTGEIGALMDRMTDLVHVDFERNRLTGSLPTRLEHLTRLEELSFYDNQLTGEIAAAVGRLAALKRLRLGVNRLTGEIPAAISDLVNLEHVALNNNALTGPLPELTRLVKLKQLYLNSNRLTGTIPSQIGQTSSLTDLGLGYNQLTGEIPASLGNLSGMRNLTLNNNQLTGRIPPQLGNLVNLETYFDLSYNKLTGGIPFELGRLSKVERFYIRENQLTGTIPASLEGLNGVRYLLLDGNMLEGPIPEQIARPELVYLFLSRNRLTGTLPAAIFTLTKLQDLSVSGNQLSGAIPPDLNRLTELVKLNLSDNQFSGPMPDMSALTKLEELEVRDNKLTSLPADLSRMKALRRLVAYRNEMTGTLAAVSGLPALQFFSASSNRFTGPLPDFSAMSGIQDFWVPSNHLSGPIPESIGAATTLKTFDVSSNLFSGELPASLATLPALIDGRSNIGFNALFTSNGSLRDFMNRKQSGGDWEATQTIAPSNVSATGKQGSSSVVVSWTPIRYQGDPGGYRIGVSTSVSGPFETLITTPSKRITAASIDGLQPSSTYFFTVTTATYPHGQQKNVVSSNPSPVVSAQTTPRNPAPAGVIVFAFPRGMVQSAGAGAAIDRFILTNVGDLSTVITLTKEGDFFNQSPASFSLAGQASQEIVLTATSSAIGSYRGSSRVSGTGVPAGLSVPVNLLVAAPPPPGSVSAQAESNRIDVTAPPTTNPTGEVKFINRGTARLTGIVVSDVGWITPLVPAPGILEIAPGATATVNFSIDRNKRPDSASLVGAAVGTLSLIYLESSPSSAARLLAYPFQGAPPGSTSTVVTVVDTVRPPTNSVSIPGITAGQVALFLPGVGNVTGGAGRFYLSDLSIFNAFGTVPLTDMNVYYTPAMGFPASSLATSVASVQPGAGITYANVVNSVFSTSEQQGTIQIRTRDWDKVFVNANIFNVRDPNGTYGTSIPLFRSDRSAAPGATLTLSGLRRDAARSVYSNLLIQETNGAPATASIQFFDSTGRVVLVDGGADRISVSVDGFTLARVLDRVPVGAVAAIITNLPSSQGRIAVYGTLVDNLSGDFWTVVDWNQQYGSNPNEPVVIPVAGSLRGANDTFFRTDLAITNLGTGSASGILRYRAGNQSYDRAFTFAGSESRSFADVVGTSFTEAGASSLGYLIFTPGVGGFSLNSRTFASVAGLPGTFGTGVPSLPLSTALRLGQSRVIAGLEVASKRTIERKKPGTFRTNIGLVEVAGATARIRVTVTYADVGSVVSASRIGILEFALEPNAFLLISNLADLIGQASASADLRNVQLKFQLISGEGAVIPFTSSVDNGTADQVFRVE